MFPSNEVPKRNDQRAAQVCGDLGWRGARGMSFGSFEYLLFSGFLAAKSVSCPWHRDGRVVRLDPAASHQTSPGPSTLRPGCARACTSLLRTTQIGRVWPPRKDGGGASIYVVSLLCATLFRSKGLELIDNQLAAFQQMLESTNAFRKSCE